MTITNTHQKFIHELGDVYDAEHRFLEGTRELAQHASDQQLKSSLQEHIGQTQQQIQNLEQVFQQLGEQPNREACDAAIGLVREAQKNLKEAEAPELRDCLIAGAASKVEHYEIASYRGLIVGAQQMGQPELVNLLQQNLQQEEQTAQTLEQSAPQLVQKAQQAESAQIAMGEASQASAQTS